VKGLTNFIFVLKYKHPRFGTDREMTAPRLSSAPKLGTYLAVHRQLPLVKAHNFRGRNPAKLGKTPSMRKRPIRSRKQSPVKTGRFPLDGRMACIGSCKSGSVMVLKLPQRATITKKLLVHRSQQLKGFSTTLKNPFLF